MWKILAEVQSEQMIGAYHAVLLFAQMCIVVGEMGGVCYFLLYIYILLKNVVNILGHVKFILNNSTCARTNVTNQELSSLFCRKMKNPYIILHSSISKGLLRASPGACGDITNRARGPNMTLPRILNHQAGEKHLTERKHRSLRFFNVCPGNVRDEDSVKGNMYKTWADWERGELWALPWRTD